MLDYLNDISLVGFAHLLVIALVIPWVLATKREPTAAVAWCLTVLMMPFFGALLYWAFGYNHLNRQVRRNLRHHQRYRVAHPPRLAEATRGDLSKTLETEFRELGKMATAAGAFPVTDGNRVALYHETCQAFDALLRDIEAARDHIHLEFFIVHSDEVGKRLLAALAARARAGVEVRLLYDALGSVHLDRRALAPLLAAGGQAAAYLPISPWRSLLRLNLRNHRKIAVIDGQLGYTGGMNIGDEYLGQSPVMGYWRDTFVRIEGPAAASLQQVFTEDWNFATSASLDAARYFPPCAEPGTAAVQIVESGPSQTPNCTRMVYFMAISSARQRLRIASPYFIPDDSLLDALRMARFRGVEVELLTILKPDHYLSYYAGRYFWNELLAMGVRVYQYSKGMMHSKILIVDDRWGIVGSANLDNRSLRLNFEAGCILYSPELVRDLDSAFAHDLQTALLLSAEAVGQRHLVTRAFENACRLMAPNL